MAGFKANGVTISTEHFPDRKKPMLCVRFDNANVIYPVASFSSEENSEFFVNAFKKMFEYKEISNET